MRYLVTGADGFLGRHFLTALAEQSSPVRAMIQRSAPDDVFPSKPEVVRAEMLEPDTLPAAVEGVTHVIHLAARVHMMNDTALDPDKAFHEVNVDGTRLLMEAAAEAGASHFLLMSTVKAMGEEEVGMLDESSPTNPTTPYGRSKLAAEKVVFEMGQACGMHVVVLRLPMVYGPGAKGNIRRLLDAAAHDRRLPFGCIDNRRSMVYVGNVVAAALSALACPAANGQIFLVCDERPYSTREFYSAICKAMGKEPLLRRIPRCLLRTMGWCGDLAEAISRRKMPVDSGVIRRITGDLCFSDRKIRTELGYAPSVSLDVGIRETVEWYRSKCGTDRRGLHALSIDVEDWYRSAIDPNAELSDRFEYNTMTVLENLAKHDVKGTFFVLGMAAEKAPHVIKAIATAGHEVQNHGFAHRSNFVLDENAFREDILKAKKLIENIIGAEVYGYRAPFFSVDERNLWVLDVLAETGHRYDSSIFPLKTKRYGIQDYPLEPRIIETPRGHRLVEAPVACFHWMGRRIPVGGGGYFRLWPYRVIRYAWRQLTRVDRPGIIYMHPYEYDPSEMSAYKKSVPWKRRFHQGLGRKAFPRKIDRLLTEFTFGRMRDILHDLLIEVESLR